MTIIGGVVYMKSMIFEDFWEYLNMFLIFLHEIFFDSKILSSTFDKYQKIDYGCSSYPENEAQNPDFGLYLDIWHFSSCLFRHKPLA